MLKHLQKNYIPQPGELGLPEDYPTPPYSDDLLFYIQRSQNKNTVVYEINRTASNDINQQLPMHPYWIRYTDGGEIGELNYIQNKLAFGYEFEVLNANSFVFNFVSYKKLKLYIAKDIDQKIKVFCRINGDMAILNNIYVYAEDFGVFPDVKFIELYGQELGDGLFSYEKIQIET